MQDPTQPRGHSPGPSSLPGTGHRGWNKPDPQTQLHTVVIFARENWRKMNQKQQSHTSAEEQTRGFREAQEKDCKALGPGHNRMNGLQNCCWLNQCLLIPSLQAREHPGEGREATGQGCTSPVLVPGGGGCQGHRAICIFSPGPEGDGATGRGPHHVGALFVREMLLKVKPKGLQQQSMKGGWRLRPSLPGRLPGPPPQGHRAPESCGPSTPRSRDPRVLGLASSQGQPSLGGAQPQCWLRGYPGSQAAKPPRATDSSWLCR